MSWAQIVATTSEREQPVLVGVHDDLRPGLQPELAQDFLDVRFDRRLAHEGGGRDLAVPNTFSASRNISRSRCDRSAMASSGTPSSVTVLLATNIASSIRGGRTRPYMHHSLGVVATLGFGHGVFQYRRVVVKGLPAWLMHRGYHVVAIPTMERKVRVLLVWLTQVLGRDTLAMPFVRPAHSAFVG